MACPRRHVCAVIVLAVVSLASAPVFALDAASTLVLYNQASPDGLQIASYYAQAHPGVRLLGLAGVPTGEQISWDVYLNAIRPQVTAALLPGTNCLVTTKGLPLRIDNPMPAGWTGSWSRYSSLESELARVDSVGTQQLMGNQSYLTSNRLASNPYYNRAGGFSFATYGTRLTSRLDGYTAADVMAGIDRAGRAVYNRPGYTFVIDDDPVPAYDRMTYLATNVLAPRAEPYTYDNTSAVITSATGPVIGYVGHGTHGGAAPDYLTNPSTGLAFALAPGAVFQTQESYNAYSFTSGVAAPVAQGQVAQWLQRGGTAGVGNVQEPNGSSTTVTNEDRMFQMLLDGYTFAEAAWNATRQLSYVNTVVGDPLMTWKSWVPGDANQDGVVDLADVLIVKTAFGSSSGSPQYDVMADMDANGIVDLSDVLKVKENYVQGLGGGGAAAWLETAPEPATLGLLALGLAAALVRRWQQRR